MDTLRQRFAANLKALADQRKSHSEVARAIGVNRHQFSAYTTGKNLPNDSIVKKICDYFQIDVCELFKEKNEKGNFDELYLRNIKFLTEYLLHQKSGAGDFPEGRYLIYFRDPRQNNTIQTSILSVSQQNNVKEFRRFTKLPNSHRSSLAELHIHTGIVISSLNRQLFLGSQIAGNPIMSIMICKPVLSANVLFSGKALVAVPDRYQPIDLVIPSMPNMGSKSSSSEMVEIFDAKAPGLDKAAIEYLFDEKNFAEW